MRRGAAVRRYRAKPDYTKRPQHEDYVPIALRLDALQRDVREIAAQAENEGRSEELQMGLRSLKKTVQRICALRDDTE